MPRIVIAAIAIYGHVAPMLAIASDLMARGHEVVVLTGSRFQAAVEATGAAFEPLEGVADIDPARFSAPERLALSGAAQLDWDLRHYVVGAVGDQWRSLQRVLALPGNGDAVVLLDSAFWGAAPGMLGAPGIRPRGFVVVGVVPLTLTSVDLAPFGSGLPPARNDEDRRAYAEAHVHAKEVVFAEAQALFQQLMAEAGVEGDVPYFFDAIALLAEDYLQLSLEELSYTPSDLPSTISFIGALPTPVAQVAGLPTWWNDVVDAEQVVVVSQGTMANHDLDELIQPALDALAGLPVLVVATTGGAGTLARVPANARVAPFVPFADLLPQTSILITNGGFGGVQQALAAGVPMVLAGVSEDKAEGNARTAHTGAAIDLRTQRPSTAAIRDAVITVLGDPSYQEHALRLRDAFAAADPFTSVADAVQRIGEGSAAPAPAPRG